VWSMYIRGLEKWSDENVFTLFNNCLLRVCIL